MAIGTTSAGAGVPLPIPVIDLALLAAGAPGAADTVAAQLEDALERVVTGQNYHGEADAPPPR